MANVLEQEMFTCFTQLNEMEKKSLVQMLKKFLNSKKDHPNRISLEEYNQEIDEAMDEINSGSVYSQEDVENMAKDW